MVGSGDRKKFSPTLTSTTCTGRATPPGAVGGQERLLPIHRDPPSGRPVLREKGTVPSWD